MTTPWDRHEGRRLATGLLGGDLVGAVLVAEGVGGIVDLLPAAFLSENWSSLILVAFHESPPTAKLVVLGGRVVLEGHASWPTRVAMGLAPSRPR